MTAISMGVPRISVADVTQNAREICAMIEMAKADAYKLLVMPELCLTGSTCGDLFRQEALIAAVDKELASVVQATADSDVCVVLGAPRRTDGALYNCAVVIHGGCERACIPKRVSQAQARWFVAGAGYGTVVVPYKDGAKRICIGFNADEVVAAADADAFVCIDASPTIVGGGASRRERVRKASLRTNAPVAYVNAGFGESTTDNVYGGEGFLYRGGACFAETEAMAFSRQFVGCTAEDAVMEADSSINNAPYDSFLPMDARREGALREVLQIQTLGLAKRFLHTRADSLVLGVSGGLDSTLAMVVCVLMMRMLKRPASDIVAVTMPGYGTSGRTYKNARALMRLLAVDAREISIKPACEQHFDDIGHDRCPDLTFENAQARERTQILLDIAGMENGLVVGTGDLTELALGFATYNGDHMSSYGVNAGVPKTVVRATVRYAAESGMFVDEVNRILIDIAETPISPELLPPLETGDISQKTEEIVGPYEINDFFLYHVLCDGAAPSVILDKAMQTFGTEYDCEFLRGQWNAFCRRFFAQQFKRSCMPDGPQVFGGGLSPRGGYVMPSDAVGAAWQL